MKDDMSNKSVDSLDTIEESYEYLVAYASDDQTTGVDQALEYIGRMRDELRTQERTLQEKMEDADDELSPFFIWTVEQTTRALSAIELFLRNEVINRETVKALLSLPPLRNCLTAYLFLEEIGGMRDESGAAV